nr:TonB-dependent receptor [Bacteroides sp.]
TTSYEQGTIKVDTTRNVVNFSPTFDYRYRFNKQSMLRINYRGRTSQPSMTDLLPITDTSDPLNISKGNPSLKPSYTNSFMLFYNTFLPEKQQSMMARLTFSNTINSVSNTVTYDEETGARITQPKNINGNWSASGGFVFNTPLKNKKFTVSTFSDGSYNNMVGFTSLSGQTDSQKNTTRSLNLSERLNGTFRNDWFEFGLNGGIRYNVSKSTLQPQSDKETFDYSFGASSNVTLPWDVTVSTDASYSMKRGYSEGLDRNELIWNAQIAKNFLKKKQATISLQIYDILKEQSNLSRSISASMRQDTEYNAINSYFMVHFVYRLNAFGKGNSRGGFDGPRPGGRGGRGGFGGGRPF